MEDGQRRSEILQAEEAIRMLADEAAKARLSASAADDAGKNLQFAVEVVNKAGDSVAEAVRAQLDLARSSSDAVKAAGDDSRQALYNAAEALQDCLRDVREACGQFQAASASIAGQADQTAQQIGERIDRLSSSVTSLEKSVWQIHVMVKPIEQNLADLAGSLLATAAAVTEIRQEFRRNPSEVAAQVRHSLGKRMGLFTSILVLSALSLGGIAVIIWLLAAGHWGF
jgi:DNA-binding ferritin-like protein